VSPVAPSTAGSSSSACPFAHIANRKDASVIDSPTYSSASSKQASTWRVLQPAEGENLPKPSGRFCWMPLVGDVFAMDSGAGKFFLERYK
jgi:hypothetical protein